MERCNDAKDYKKIVEDANKKNRLVYREETFANVLVRLPYSHRYSHVYRLYRKG